MTATDIVKMQLAKRGIKFPMNRSIQKVTTTDRLMTPNLSVGKLSTGRKPSTVRNTFYGNSKPASKGTLKHKLNGK